jgi:hypothetical protein
MSLLGEGALSRRMYAFVSGEAPRALLVEGALSPNNCKAMGEYPAGLEEVLR